MTLFMQRPEFLSITGQAYIHQTRRQLKYSQVDACAQTLSTSDPATGVADFILLQAPAGAAPLGLESYDLTCNHAAFH